MNKKKMLLIPVLLLGVLGSAQHLETTIKQVRGNIRIAVKAVGGDITGFPSNYIFSVAIPQANKGATMNAPKVLDASRMPPDLAMPLGSYKDDKYEYFNLFYTGTPSAAVIFENGVEYELLELNWEGRDLSFPVSLTCPADGNPKAPSTPYQWFNYLEVGGRQYSFGDVLFYQSTTSTAPVQMAANFTSGTALITTSKIVKPSMPGNTPFTLAIGGLFPNPARTMVNVIIDAPARQSLTVLVNDINGKTVKQQIANVETGSNTIPLEIGHLAQGSYLVKVICKSDCETTVAKFNKQ